MEWESTTDEEKNIFFLSPNFYLLNDSNVQYVSKADEYFPQKINSIWNFLGEKKLERER